MKTFTQVNLACPLLLFSGEHQRALNSLIIKRESIIKRQSFFFICFLILCLFTNSGLKAKEVTVLTNNLNLIESSTIQKFNPADAPPGRKKWRSLRCYNPTKYWRSHPNVKATEGRVSFTNPLAFLSAIKPFKGFSFNKGLRINNFVLYDFRPNENNSEKNGTFNQFFPGRNEKPGKFSFIYRVKKGEVTFFHHPKDHLLVIKKNRGYIENGAMNEMDGADKVHVPCNAKKIPLFMVIIYEFAFIYTNHNFIGDE